MNDESSERGAEDSPEELFPMGLLAELSHRCPLRCPYCSNPEVLARKSAEVDTSTWLQAFEEAADLGVLQVHLSGGEPTVRQDLEVLVQGAEEAGLYTNLITSGVLLSEQRLHELASRGLQHVQLSMQGASENLNDTIGGFSGGFKKKLRCAQWVVKARLPLTVNAVLHRQNIHELEEIIALALEMGAQRLEIAHTQYLGWALKNRAALMPTREQVAWSTEIVEKAREELRGQLLIDYVIPDYFAVRPKPCMGGWGRQFLVIAPDGVVYPCHGAAELPGLEFWSIKEKGLEEIWQASPAFQAYRGTDWMPPLCRQCDRREVDWGGCRCQAFALTGDAANTDPVCALSTDHHLIEAAREEAHQSFLYRGEQK